jgi:hypothetical protein
MFEYGSMSPTLTLHSSASTRREQVSALREQIRSLEAPRMDAPVYPTVPALTELFPDHGLRRGAIYELSPQHTLLWALIAQMTQLGHFVGLVGLQHLGLRSAQDLGVDLERLVIISDPRGAWWDATTTLVDALSLVALRPGGTVPSAHQRDRFHARLRERGATLLLSGRWPGADASVSVEQSRWDGIEAGAGVLQRQHLTLAHRSRRDADTRRIALTVSADGIQPEREQHDHYLVTSLPERADVAPVTHHRQAG